MFRMFERRQTLTFKNNWNVLFPMKKSNDDYIRIYDKKVFEVYGKNKFVQICQIN